MFRRDSKRESGAPRISAGAWSPAVHVRVAQGRPHQFLDSGGGGGIRTVRLRKVHRKLVKALNHTLLIAGMPAFARVQVRTNRLIFAFTPDATLRTSGRRETKATNENRTPDKFAGVDETMPREKPDSRGHGVREAIDL